MVSDADPQGSRSPEHHRTAVDDPDVAFYENYMRRAATTNYCNPEVDQLIDRRSVESDVAAQKAVSEISAN
jgi:hypothetical protein